MTSGLFCCDASVCGGRQAATQLHAAGVTCNLRPVHPILTSNTTQHATRPCPQLAAEAASSSNGTAALNVTEMVQAAADIAATAAQAAKANMERTIEDKKTGVS